MENGNNLADINNNENESNSNSNQTNDILFNKKKELLEKLR